MYVFYELLQFYLYQSDCVCISYDFLSVTNIHRDIPLLPFCLQSHCSLQIFSLYNHFYFLLFLVPGIDKGIPVIVSVHSHWLLQIFPSYLLTILSSHLIRGHLLCLAKWRSIPHLTLHAQSNCSLQIFPYIT